MVWNSVSPDGTLSVKANTTPMLQNTTYTETTLNVDHYWNIGSDEDGRHKQVQMPKSAIDITLGTGMDGGIFLKETSYGKIEAYYKNVNAVYQFTPSFLSGSKVLSTTLNAIIVAIPNESYGYINMFRTGTADTAQSGWFLASGGICRAYSNATQKSGFSASTLNVKYLNDGSGGLNLLAKAEQGGAGTYQYRITIWAI